MVLVFNGFVVVWFYDVSRLEIPIRGFTVGYKFNT